MRLYPLKLKAALKDYLWGGAKLKTDFHKDTDWEKVAESWELSCHKDGQSVIENGARQGLTLAEYIELEGRRVLGERAAAFSYFPILIKLIDARDNLSVQVHPDNAYALEHEGEYGKTEMWYIVDCEEGASLLYGFQTPITKEEFKERIENETLLPVLNRVPVKKGDVFFIDAGTLHAIGKGIVIAEIQQNSNTTYRIYDYGRLGSDGKPRALHTDKALDVTRLAPPPQAAEERLALDFIQGCGIELLARCAYFTVYHIDLEQACAFTAGGGTFHSLLVLEGELTLCHLGENMRLIKGDSVFIPAGMGEYRLDGRAELILSMV